MTEASSGLVETLAMDRRMALATMVALSTGCRGNAKSYDRGPRNWSVAEHGQGWYFQRVLASYSLPLYHSAASLSRPAEPPVVVPAAGKQPQVTVPPVADVRPTHADVELDYHVAADSPTAVREVRVTVHWPAGEQSTNAPPAGRSESRTGRIDWELVQALLEASNRFRVDREEPYYSLLPVETPQTWAQADFVPPEVTVELKIEGAHPDSNLDESLVYRNLAPLFTLAQRAWPGIG